MTAKTLPKTPAGDPPKKQGDAMLRRAYTFVVLFVALSVPAAAQVTRVPQPWASSSGVARSTLTVPAGSDVRILMATPSSVAATPSALGTDLADGVYTLTVTALDAGGGETIAPTAITCTVANAPATTGRCAVTWSAVPGAASYRVWTSLADGATPSRYFASATTSYNLDTLTAATVATLPAAAAAYVVNLDSNGASWLFGGSLSLPYVSKSAHYTATMTDYVIDCTTNSFTVTLPTAVGVPGRLYIIKNSGAATTITLDGDGAETIDGAASQALTGGMSLTVQSTGAAWIIL